MSKTIEPGTLFNAADSIAYADGAVVSKTILKKPAGNITLFAFDAGEGLSEHTTPHEALLQVLDGSVEITIGGDVFNLSAGQSLILPASVPHAVKAVEKFKMMLTMLKS
jgi:quercetin dioxygenase-like cupin family protein